MSGSDAAAYAAWLADPGVGVVAEPDDGRGRDALWTGTTTVGGVAAALAVSDFDVLAGSLGSLAGERFVALTRRCAAERRPLVVVARSGGARLQEGPASLVAMRASAAAMAGLRAAGVPTVAVLRDPCTGGVWASYAGLCDVRLAEAGALVTFSGPRVATATGAGPLPADFGRAERLLAHGHVDRVVGRREMADEVRAVVALLGRPVEPGRLPDAGPEPAPSTPAAADRPLDAWSRVLAARHPRRPTTLGIVARIATAWVELSGDRVGGADPAIAAGLARIAGRTVVVAGHERSRAGGRPSPAGLRTVARMATLAQRLGLPFVTVVDTPGARPGAEAEDAGLAGAIAECLATLGRLTVPALAVVVGEGGSGGALALAAVPRVAMLERAIFGVIAPEGAAAILYRDPAQAARAAARIPMDASSAAAAGLVDAILAEPPGGAHTDPGATALTVGAAILEVIGAATP